jgi:hypothetical protein
MTERGEKGAETSEMKNIFEIEKEKERKTETEKCVQMVNGNK